MISSCVLCSVTYGTLDAWLWRMPRAGDRGALVKGRSGVVWELRVPTICIGLSRWSSRYRLRASSDCPRLLHSQFIPDPCEARSVLQPRRTGVGSCRESWEESDARISNGKEIIGSNLKTAAFQDNNSSAGITICHSPEGRSCTLAYTCRFSRHARKRSSCELQSRWYLYNLDANLGLYAALAPVQCFDKTGSSNISSGTLLSLKIITLPMTLAKHVPSTFLSTSGPHRESSWDVCRVPIIASD